MPQPFAGTQLGPDGKRYPIGSVPSVEDMSENPVGPAVRDNTGRLVEVGEDDPADNTPS